MALDEAMMFPNERIKTWLDNNRTNSQKNEEANAPSDAPTLELETAEVLEPEHAERASV